VTTRITFIYDNPNDPIAFEADHPDLMAMARAIPGFQRVDTSQAWSTRIAAALRLTGRRARPQRTGRRSW